MSGPALLHVIKKLYLARIILATPIYTDEVFYMRHSGNSQPHEMFRSSLLMSTQFDSETILVLQDFGSTARNMHLAVAMMVECAEKS
jgi:hypothetical protein